MLVDIATDDYTECHRCRQAVPSSWVAGRDSKRKFICEDCHLSDLASDYFAEDAIDLDGRAAA